MDFIELIRKGVTQYHVVEAAKAYLKKQGFSPLDMGTDWELLPYGNYYITPFPSELIAFSVGKTVKQLRIVTAHTDFPMLKLKSQPDWEKSGYHMVNVEPYGGLIMETWFDRPLGMAGKVVLKTGLPFSPEVRLYDSKAPVFVIPSLAPHLKKEDKAGKLDIQKELVPLYGVDGSEEPGNGILTKVADALGCGVNDILDYDLYLYNADQPELLGADRMLLSAPRIDNLSSVAASLSALVRASGKAQDQCTDGKEQNRSNLNIIALFDNEEIGSRSKQGADSVMLQSVLQRICDALHLSKADRYALMQHAFLASADVAHALHPNYADKSDPTNAVIPGKGVVLKTSAGQRYVTDSEASAVVLALGQQNGISIQRQVNRSGMAGGQTLGPVVSSYLPVLAADLGIPVLAMHSARELAHRKDYEALTDLLTALFL